MSDAEIDVLKAEIREHELRAESLRAHNNDLAGQLEAAEDDAEQLWKEKEELLDALEDVVNQACSGREGDPELDSMALSAYAHGLRELAKHKRVKITHQYGRRVIAEWIKREN